MVLTWTPPSTDGGAEITGYRVEHRIEGGFKWEHSNEGETSSDSVVRGHKYSVTGLREHTLYEFRVAAINRAGAGEFTECSMPVEVQEPVGEL